VCGFTPDARGAAARELPDMKLEELQQRLSGDWPTPENGAAG